MSAYSIKVSGNYAYITNSIGGLRIINISNPSNPFEAGFFNANNDEARDVAISGNYAFVTYHNKGFRVIDVSNPTNPSEISHTDTDGTAERITVNGDYAYVAYGYYGLQIFDISNLTNPVKKAYFDADDDVASYTAEDVAVSGNNVYMAYGNYGLCIIRNDLISSIKEDEVSYIPDGFMLKQNYPNPFNPSTRILYAVSSMQYVTLKVYDVLGKVIATLVDEENPAGSYEINFDAANLSSGIYFYKIQAGDFVETKKMVLLR